MRTFSGFITRLYSKYNISVVCGQNKTFADIILCIRNHWWTFFNPFLAFFYISTNNQLLNQGKQSTKNTNTDSNIHQQGGNQRTWRPTRPWHLTSVMSWHVTWTRWKGFGWVRGRKRDETAAERKEGKRKYIKCDKIGSVQRVTKARKTEYERASDSQMIPPAEHTSHLSTHSFIRAVCLFPSLKQTGSSP